MPRTESQSQRGEGRRAANYARVSDKSQAEDDKTSLYEQVADMESYCMKEGLTITARYQEVGHGWSKGRPEFQRMLADARSGLFDTIVCLEVRQVEPWHVSGSGLEGSGGGPSGPAESRDGNHRHEDLWSHGRYGQDRD